MSSSEAVAKWRMNWAALAVLVTLPLGLSAQGWIGGVGGSRSGAIYEYEAQNFGGGSSPRTGAPQAPSYGSADVSWAEAFSKIRSALAPSYIQSGGSGVSKSGGTSGGSGGESNGLKARSFSLFQGLGGGTGGFDGSGGELVCLAKLREIYEEALNKCLTLPQRLVLKQVAKELPNYLKRVKALNYISAMNNNMDDKISGS